MSDRQKVDVSRDICKALNYLHLMRPEPLLHRDVSSSNVLLQQSRDVWGDGQAC